MPVITVRDVVISFGGGHPLLDGANLSLERGERIGLLGRNGSGKSTLLKIIADIVPPDEGEVERRSGVRTAYLDQHVPDDLTGTVFDVVAGGLEREGDLLAEYHRVSHRLAEEGGQELVDELGRLQHELDAAGAWQLQTRVETTVSRMALDPDAVFQPLSGGMQRRVLLARALVRDPDVLLLDEPTNHLDVEAIEWLEDFLLRYDGALLFVTHDRRFLRRLARRVVEIDRGRLLDFDCGYDAFVERKEALLEAEAKQREQFDKRVAEEEIWIRQGLKARRTRNMGRVRRLQEMREQVRRRRERTGVADITANTAGRSGRKVIETEGVTFSYDDEPIVRDLEVTIMRGDRIGILGPNGSGKTTLIRLLLGELEPDEGTVRHGTKLQVAYFDQHREQLDPDATVRDSITQGEGDTVTLNGHEKHVVSYLQDFLFTPERARTQVRYLSGGERNRLLLARLFTRPSNLLVLDEPTNDLDVETLELLEEVLLDYPGTLLLVSHDRAFIDNVVTSTLALEGGGRVHAYPGGYDDYLRQRPDPEPDAQETRKKEKKQKKARPEKRERTGLSYKERNELTELPGRIEQLEEDQAALQEEMADPSFYQQDGDAIAEAVERLEKLERQVDAAYTRWAELEELKEG